MGKYMKKSKAVRGNIAVVEGVRTRAKTLALQRLNLEVVVDESSLCYLQLRSRRLEKSPPPSKQQQQRYKDKACCRARDNGKQNQNQEKNKESNSLNEVENATYNELGLEASFGDNILDFVPRDRSTRESTPCSLIRGCDTIGSPDSTIRRTISTATNQGVRSNTQRIMPTTHEIEEFFTCVERQQQRYFIEKYNFDIVNDLPLPGRYRWVQVVP